MAHMRIRPDAYETELPIYVQDALFDLHKALLKWNKSEHIQVTFSPVLSDQPPTVDLIL